LASIGLKTFYVAGLDLKARPRLLEVLRSLHQARSPRVIMGLRTQDTVPDWITHVAFVKNGRVQIGDKTQVLRAELERSQHQNSALETSTSSVQSVKEGEIVADLRNIRVQYQERKVCTASLLVT
jgi:ABC-type uncharacterized transport system ATPase subunit